MIDWGNGRVVVGGGCGFLGSYLVPALARAGAHVTIVDNLENGDASWLGATAGSVTLVEADLRERAVCERVLPGHDLFINLAARASGVGDRSTASEGRSSPKTAFRTWTSSNAWAFSAPSAKKLTCGAGLERSVLVAIMPAIRSRSESWIVSRAAAPRSACMGALSDGRAARLSQARKTWPRARSRRAP